MGKVQAELRREGKACVTELTVDESHERTWHISCSGRASLELWHRALGTKLVCKTRRWRGRRASKHERALSGTLFRSQVHHPGALMSRAMSSNRPR